MIATPSFHVFYPLHKIMLFFTVGISRKRIVCQTAVETTLAERLIDCKFNMQADDNSFK